jgi:RimJ/RimL family protein N-acetyltransferase
MRFYPSVLTREQSDDFARHAQTLLAERGWSLWAVEVQGGAEFIGYVGLANANFEAHFIPATEVGWRLGRQHWGHGYATEAAIASVRFGFGELGLEEIVSFTSTINQRSRAVMQRIGMTRDPADDFDHPRVAKGPLRRHVLYRMHRSAGPGRQPA